MPRWSGSILDDFSATTKPAFSNTGAVQPCMYTVSCTCWKHMQCQPTHIIQSSHVHAKLVRYPVGVTTCFHPAKHSCQAIVHTAAQQSNDRLDTHGYWVNSKLLSKLLSVWACCLWLQVLLPALAQASSWSSRWSSCWTLSRSARVCWPRACH